MSLKITRRPRGSDPGSKCIACKEGDVYFPIYDVAIEIEVDSFVSSLLVGFSVHEPCLTQAFERT